MYNNEYFTGTAMSFLFFQPNVTGSVNLFNFFFFQLICIGTHVCVCDIISVC
jgi:hypothetical protein